MEHSFNVNLAKEYGIEEAVMINNLYFWIKHNVANKVNSHDGRYWTFNSAKALSELFPYMNDKKIARVLTSLSDRGLVLKGHFCDDKSIRTNWYSFSDQGIAVLGECGYDISGFSDTMDAHFSKMGNAIPENGECIYIDSNNNSKIEDKKQEDIKELKEKFASFVKKYKKAGGRVRGVDTEFNDFAKRHKDWKEIIPYLDIALEKEIKERESARIGRKFYPEMKNLQTYLGKQRAWEVYVTIGEDLSNEYMPSGHNVYYDELRGFYYYTGFYMRSNDIMDGYTDEERPDGAKLCLNNARGVIQWNANNKEWIKL